MFSLTIEEFIDEVKTELYAYEEIEEKKITLWEEKFLKLLERKKIKSMKISGEDVILEDETDIFQIADGFWSSIENNEEDEYWENI